MTKGDMSPMRLPKIKTPSLSQNRFLGFNFWPKQRIISIFFNTSTFHFT